MNEQAFCPRCGYDLADHHPVIINDFSIFGPGHPLCYKGRPLKLTHYEADVCWTLMRAYPGIVRGDTILDRIDSDGTPNTLNVLIHRIRKKLRDMCVPDPIETIRASGYAWKAGGPESTGEEA